MSYGFSVGEIVRLKYGLYDGTVLLIEPDTDIRIEKVYGTGNPVDESYDIKQVFGGKVFRISLYDLMRLVYFSEVAS